MYWKTIYTWISSVPSPAAPPPQPRLRIHFNPEKSLFAKLFGIDFGNAFGRPFRRGSGVTPLRGYFKTSAGIFAAGHFAKPWGRVFVTTIFAVAGTRENGADNRALIRLTQVYLAPFQ